MAEKRNTKQKYNGEEISIKIERNGKQEEYHIKNVVSIIMTKNA